MKVANDPSTQERETLERAVEELRAALASKELSAGEEAAARTGAGRCLFALGRLEDAETEFRAALDSGAGGPFHRGWVRLRLGCIADLSGRRDEAITHYRAVVDSPGASKSAVAKARVLLDRAYRGFAQDG